MRSLSRREVHLRTDAVLPVGSAYDSAQRDKRLRFSDCQHRRAFKFCQDFWQPLFLRRADEEKVDSLRAFTRGQMPDQQLAAIDALLFNHSPKVIAKIVLS